MGARLKGTVTSVAGHGGPVRLPGLHGGGLRVCIHLARTGPHEPGARLPQRLNGKTSQLPNCEIKENEPNTKFFGAEIWRRL